MLAFLLWPVLLFGCALSGPLLQKPASLDIPSHVQLEQVPFFPQEAYQCGPASLAMVLSWAGYQVQPEDLVPMVYLPDRRGSLQTGLIGASRRFGFLAFPIRGRDGLLCELAAGIPVIVLQNLGLSWVPKWHYAVVIGYDLNEQVVILHTGLEADRKVPYSTFARTWNRAEDWGLLVLPAGRIPACAEELPYLKAVLGLDRAGRLAETLTALRAAVRRWPVSAQVRMALGNALYADGNLNGSAQAFSQATRLAPRNGAAFNNLAHVLAELGDLNQAEQAARKAVALGGPRSDLYRKTLNDIVARQPRKGGE
ncbi:MAG: PA2778 family cysteine peptidase [Desulfosarcinaceae bacterium]